MKKRQILLFVGMSVAAISLSSCDLSIFDFFSSSDDSYAYSSYVDSSFSSEMRGGYSKEQASFRMYNIGKRDGIPYLNSVGNPKILVLPISIKGYERNATSSNLERIKKAFKGQNDVWQSVESYYNISSFGKLNLDITVAGSWYQSNKTPAEIDQGDTETEGVETLINEAVAWYKQKNSTNGLEFDSDEDGYIDAVWCVYSCPNYTKDASLSSYTTTCWAYTYWADNEANEKSPSVGTFGWASYDFMDEGYGSSKSDAHTFIHETGHMMGLDDYYDYNVASATDGSSPMGYIDMMDANIIDHNVYSKWVLGWVTPFVVTGTGTITISPSSTTGECLVIPTSKGWQGSPFEEYIMLELYTPDNLNKKDSASQYTKSTPQAFTVNGVRIYHVDSRLAKYQSNRQWAYTDTLERNCHLAHSNTPSYGTDTDRQTRNRVSPNYRLIQAMDATKKRNLAKTVAYLDNSSLFTSGSNFTFASYRSSFPNGTKMNNGYSFNYKVSFSDVSSSGVTITIANA